MTILNILSVAIIMTFLTAFILFIMAFIDLGFKIILVDDPNQIFEIIKNQKKKYQMIMKGLFNNDYSRRI